MAREVYEGKTNVYWLTALANIAAPTVAEITAGTNLAWGGPTGSGFIPKDGVAVNITTNNVDTAGISEVFDSEDVGSWGSSVEITMFRDNVTDTAWNLCVYGTPGFLVLDRFRNSGTLPSVGNKVEVFPAKMHQPAMQNSAANTVKRFTEKFAITSTPNQKATVA